MLPSSMSSLSATVTVSPISSITLLSLSHQKHHNPTILSMQPHFHNGHSIEPSTYLCPKFIGFFYNTGSIVTSFPLSNDNIHGNSLNTMQNEEITTSTFLHVHPKLRPNDTHCSRATLGTSCMSCIIGSLLMYAAHE